MKLKSKVNGIPNGRHKRYIQPLSDKAKLKTGDYELIIGEEYEVNFPETETYWDLDENDKRVKKEKAYEVPDWFESKKPTNKVPGSKG